MVSSGRFLLLAGVVLLAGCGTARRVAVTSFRVLDAPARYVRERIDPETTTTTTTTTSTGEVSDVVTPGHPIDPAPHSHPTRPSPNVAKQSRSSSGGSPSPRPSRTTTAGAQRRPAPSATPRAQASVPAFPTARPVPGRPGYVYSIDPNGGIVDVTGYKSGDKAKDPYTQKVFIVP